MLNQCLYTAVIASVKMAGCWLNEGSIWLLVVYTLISLSLFVLAFLCSFFSL